MALSTQPVATGGESSNLCLHGLQYVNATLPLNAEKAFEGKRIITRSPHSSLRVCVCHSKAGITEVFEGHHGPVTGLSCHSAGGPVDFSHLFISSSFDWTVKLWSTKVRHLQSHTR